ncbi:MAG: hypothetical protein AAF449_03725, partial [Myxococcota bacterium]
MVVTPTYPGVYVQEVSSGVRTIAGVSTSTALFIGYTKSGPVNAPTRCFSYTDYVRTYGDDDSASEMNRQVKLAFLNGLTEAYILRVADGAQPAEVVLSRPDGTAALTLTARYPGAIGDNIRASVSYGGNAPESTFNLTLWRWVQQPTGQIVAEALERWTGLSMNPASASFAESFLDANSELVTATAAAPPATLPFSQSISMWPFVGADWTSNAAGRSIEISIDGSRFVTITLPPLNIDASGTAADIEAQIVARFSAELLPAPALSATDFGVDVITVGADDFLSFRSGNGDVLVRPAANDATAFLHLGAGQGG